MGFSLSVGYCAHCDLEIKNYDSRIELRFNKSEEEYAHDVLCPECASRIPTWFINLMLRLKVWKEVDCNDQ
jgi:hypothetical protein